MNIHQWFGAKWRDPIRGELFENAAEQAKILEKLQIRGEEAEAFTFVYVGIVIGMHFQFFTDETHGDETLYLEVFEDLHPEDLRHFVEIIGRCLHSVRCCQSPK